MKRRTKTIVWLSVVSLVALALVWYWQMRHSRYLHLYSRGGWGTDIAVWVYPDDTFSVERIRLGPDGSVEKRTGRREGCFREIVSLVDARNAWQITTVSLADEVASFPEARGISVFDSNHTYLEFRIGDRTLVADFYAASSMLPHMSNAQQLTTYRELEKALFDIIKSSK
jgi:hypothetical protein